VAADADRCPVHSAPACGDEKEEEDKEEEDDEENVEKEKEEAVLCAAGELGTDWDAPVVAVVRNGDNVAGLLSQAVTA
jgi:hypothetical protein